jgi:IS5 family transposase
MLDRQEIIYGRCPLKVALDGGFASKANLKAAKDKGIVSVHGVSRSYNSEV